MRRIAMSSMSARIMAASYLCVRLRCGGHDDLVHAHRRPRDPHGATAARSKVCAGLPRHGHLGGPRTDRSNLDVMWRNTHSGADQLQHRLLHGPGDGLQLWVRVGQRLLFSVEPGS